MSQTGPSHLDSLSGCICLRVVPSDALGSDARKALHAVIEQFLQALRLGALPGELVGLYKFVQSPEGAVDARFELRSVEAGAFRVLGGMLSHFSLVISPLRSAVAWPETSPSTNLFDTRAPLPKLRVQVPFAVSLLLSKGAAPPLVLNVVFRKALSRAEKEQLEQELRVWVALVQGGYPRIGNPSGHSALGPFTIRFDDDWTLRLSAEGFFAGEEAFESLEALLLGWCAWVPVASLESE